MYQNEASCHSYYLKDVFSETKGNDMLWLQYIVTDTKDGAKRQTIWIIWQEI